MIVYCCQDLIFATKIRSTAEAVGIVSRPARNRVALLDRLRCVDDGKPHEPVSGVLIDLELGEAGLGVTRDGQGPRRSDPGCGVRLTRGDRCPPGRPRPRRRFRHAPQPIPRHPAGHPRTPRRTIDLIQVPAWSISMKTPVGCCDHLRSLRRVPRRTATVRAAGAFGRSPTIPIHTYRERVLTT